nr:hypothetical protein [uncultured Peptostreptococcus sp.]
MAGLIRENFKEEVLIELSWIMNAIDEITQRYGIETYETVLIKYRIQPEEEKAIDRFIALNFKKIESLAIEDIQKEIAKYYFQLTKREWSVSDEIVEKLIRLNLDILQSDKKRNNRT